MLHQLSHKKVRCKSEAEGLIRKVNDILHQPAFQAAPPLCPLHIWRGGRGQCRVIVLKVMLHTFGKYIRLLLGYWNVLTLTGKELKVVREAKKYHLNIVGVSSTERHGSGIVNLDGGSFSGADPSMSAKGCGNSWYALSCWTECLIAFLCDHGPVC